MDGNRTAGWAVSPVWEDKSCIAQSHGYRWSSITTAWVKILWAAQMVNLAAPVSILTTASKSSITTIRKRRWTRLRSHSQETWDANMAVGATLSAPKV